MEFRALGPLEVVDDAGAAVTLGGRKPRAVLAYLLANAGEVCSVDQLVEAAWGDGLPANPKGTLQVAVSRLRKVLGAGYVVARDPGYVARRFRHQLIGVAAALDVPESYNPFPRERGKNPEQGTSPIPPAPAPLLRSPRSRRRVAGPR